MTNKQSYAITNLLHNQSGLKRKPFFFCKNDSYRVSLSPTQREVYKYWLIRHYFSFYSTQYTIQMTSRISKMLSRTGSIRHKNITNTIRNAVVSDSNGYGSNEFIHKSFYDGENYESILKCLNGGHAVATDLISMMKDYRELLKDQSHALKSFASKCKSKLNSQTSISSYNTTKRAQRDALSSSENLAELIDRRCEAIQQVITNYDQQVQRMYPRDGLNSHKHYRADVMKRLFKNARSQLADALEEMKKLLKDQATVEESLRQAQIQQQNLQLNETTSQSKLFDVNNKVERRTNELKSIENRLNQAKENVDKQQENYRVEAQKIYEQCRTLEEERLNQIRQTLIDFINAIHSNQFVTEQSSLYEKLLSTIESDQNTLADLDFWAKTYHVDIPCKSIDEEQEEEDADQQPTTEQKTKS